MEQMATSESRTIKVISTIFSGSITLNYRKNKLGISGNANSGKYTQQQYYILSNGNDSYKLTSKGTVTAEHIWEVILILIMKLTTSKI